MRQPAFWGGFEQKTEAAEILFPESRGDAEKHLEKGSRRVRGVCVRGGFQGKTESAQPLTNIAEVTRRSINRFSAFLRVSVPPR